MSPSKFRSFLVRTCAWLLLVGCFGPLASVAQGQLLAYEAFDYTPGTTIRGQSGGVGWLDSWEATFHYSAGLSFEVFGEGLGYVDQGLGIQALGSAILADDSFERTEAREWDAAGRYGAGDEVWMSLLITDGPNNDGWRIMICPDQEGEADGFGLINSGVNTHIYSSIGPDILSPPVVLEAGTHLLVLRLRFEIGENDVFSLWVDPALAEEPDERDAITLEANITPGSNYNHIWIRAFGLNNQAADIAIDELRIGTSFYAVTPVYVACACDSDGDEYIDIVDLLALLAGWGTPVADCTDDGITDVSDLLALLSSWGDCAQP